METGTIKRSLRHWWVFLIRGLLFIAVAIYMVCSPITSFVALGFMFGLIIFLAGIVELLHVYRENDAHNRGWHLILGIIDIVLGIILMGHIAASLAILRIIIGIWFLFRGLSLFSFSGLARRSWLLALGGILTIIFAILILFNPVFGTMTMVIYISLAFLITGFFNIIQAFWLKQKSLQTLV
jgi:uncharacterized membrane protein HdeD (DUF308 family)